MKGNIKAALAMFVTSLLLTACGKGLDGRLTTADEQAYRQSLDVLVKDMSATELQAFNWSVSNLSIPDIHKRYPNASPRQIIRGETEQTIREGTVQLAKLEQARTIFDPILADIRKVEANDVRYGRSRDFFGDKTLIGVTVSNHSARAYAALGWRADLYLNDDEAPSAHAALLDSYTGAEQGLKPGQSLRRVFQITSFGFGNGDWHTLEVKQAKKVRIVLTLVPEDAQDLGERHYLAGAPYAEINQLKSVLASAAEHRKALGL